MSGGPGDGRAISVVLVEDHLTFAQALEAVFSLEPDLRVLAVVAQADDAGVVARRLTPDVAVVDLDLPGGGGELAIRGMREASPRTRFLVLTASRDRLELARVVEAGVSGLLHKSADMPRVLEGVRRVARGDNLLPPAVVAALLGDLGAARRHQWRSEVARATLSPRETEILAGLAQGRTVQDIAHMLGISAGTAETHLRNARSKLGVSSRLHAVVEAIRLNLVDPPRELPGDLPDFG